MKNKTNKSKPPEKKERSRVAMPKKKNPLKKRADTESIVETIRDRAIKMKTSSERDILVKQLFRALKSTGLLPVDAAIYVGATSTSSKNPGDCLIGWNGQPIKSTTDPYQRLTDAPKSSTHYRLFVRRYPGTEKNELIRILSEVPAVMADKEHRNLVNGSSKKIILTKIFFPGGHLGILSGEAVSDGAGAILQSFAKLLAFIQVRWLDLRNAEANAREVLIEAALEKVRAKTLAMHRSAQLAETAQVLFEQFDLLGKIPDRMSIGIFNEETMMVELWVTDQTGIQLNNEFFFDLSEPTSMAKIYAAWKKKEPSIVVDLTGQNLVDWLQFVKLKAKLPVDESRIRGRRVQQAFFFCQGFLLFTTHEPIAEELMQLLVRFARVFDLTYTRFRDLLIAEAQARDAQIASSLDRLRAEIASMRTTSDLQRITPLLWHELTVLGVPFVRCGVFIIDEARSVEQAYLSTPDGHSLAILNLPFNSNDLSDKVLDHWRKGIVYKRHWDKNEFQNWTQAMIDQGQVATKETYIGNSPAPESLDLHFAPFKQGMLYVGNKAPLSQHEIDLVKSLAEAFSIAYSRYEDFRSLEQAKLGIEAALNELKSTQTQLIQSEKMASLGEVTAGIAHEIQNPLNFVTNFSDLNDELINEMTEAMNKGDLEEARLLAKNIRENEEKINHHGKRADAIVKSMLYHSQISSGNEEMTDLNSLADQYLKLAYQSLRAKDKTLNPILVTDFDPSMPLIPVIRQDMGRVILNICNNAFYAMAEKQKSMHTKGVDEREEIKVTHSHHPDKFHSPETNADLSAHLTSHAGALANGYEPTLSISTKNTGDKIQVRIHDNGTGIPQKIIAKIFQPFFTTKDTGKGTGLGLFLSYDIVKMHRGDLRAESVEGSGSEFIIELPA